MLIISLPRPAIVGVVAIFKSDPISGGTHLPFLFEENADKKPESVTGRVARRRFGRPFVTKDQGFNQ